MAAAERTLMLVFGKRLEQLANEHGGTMAFLAVAGISQCLFDDTVAGAGNVTCATMEKVARNLDMSIFELLGLSDEFVSEQLAKINIDLDTLSQKPRALTKPVKKIAVPALS